ncbi:MAG: hypothetical protein H7Y20_14705 [Bryobacteraceae bacterium]|nr:hypothetical protein [Bryobacteraceae bacterium]
MDIRSYFRKIREIESSLSTPWIVMMSLETPDGGKPGLTTEVTRYMAAQLIVENRARLATEAEAHEYRAGLEQARADAEHERMASKVQFAVISEENIRAMKTGIRPKA